MRGSHAVALGILASLLCACQREPQPEPEERSAVLMKVEADPTISVSVSFAVGSQNDPAGKEGLAFLTGQMIADAATQNNTLDEILEKLYPLAAGYDVRVDRERTTLTGRTHRDNAEVYLSLFTDAFLRPAFTESDFDRVKSDAINEIENTLRYSSDEELAKALLFKSAFQHTPYAHPPEGTAAGLRAVTLDDVRNFYRAHCTQANALLSVGGGFDDSFVTALQQSLEQLPEGSRMAAPPITPQPLEGIQVTVIDKPRSDASISFGFPLDVHRGERDFYALWIANSWLGEHRSQASHLFQVIREIRGLNYGDYSYIEAYP
jgi:zinc protease